MLTAFLLSRALAGTLCTDGWNSPSSGSGTCSHHGGEWQPIPSPYVPMDPVSPCVTPNLSSDAARDAWIAEQTKDRLDVELACLKKEQTRIEAERDFLLAHPPKPPKDSIEAAREAMRSSATIDTATFWAGLVNGIGEENARVWAHYGTKPGACMRVIPHEMWVYAATGTLVVLRKGYDAEVYEQDDPQYWDKVHEYRNLSGAEVPLCND
jgi:hypothetical protein